MGKIVNIVELYGSSDIDERINILIVHYTKIEKLLDGCEQNLGFLVRQAKTRQLSQKRGELGVRVQTSVLNDSTYNEAVSNIEVKKAIAERDYRFLRDYLEDDETMAIVRRELSCIDDMREDFQTFKNCFDYLDDDNAKMYETYLNCGRKTEKSSYEYDMKPRTFKAQMHRAKCVVVEQTGLELRRKYCCV